MTKSECAKQEQEPPARPFVPAWVVLDSDGILHEQQGPYHHPTRALHADPQAILAIRVGGLQVIVAPGPRGQHAYISTVDVRLNAPGSRRVVGPGIRSPKAVRAWVGPLGKSVILTDGPLEQALAAHRKLQEATNAR